MFEIKTTRGFDISVNVEQDVLSWLVSWFVVCLHWTKLNGRYFPTADLFYFSLQHAVVCTILSCSLHCVTLRILWSITIKMSLVIFCHPLIQLILVVSPSLHCCVVDSETSDWMQCVADDKNLDTRGTQSPLSIPNVQRSHMKVTLRGILPCFSWSHTVREGRAATARDSVKTPRCL